MSVELKLECKCLSEGAKRNLMGALNTVITLAQGNTSRLEEEIAEHRKRFEPVPVFKNSALIHLKSDLANAQELKSKIALIPVCPTSP